MHCYQLSINLCGVSVCVYMCALALLFLLSARHSQMQWF